MATTITQLMFMLYIIMRDQHRKGRLAHLVAADYGGRSAFVEANPWCSPARLSQTLGKRCPFAEDASMLWEGRLGLPRGWFNSNAPTPNEARRLGLSLSALPKPSERPLSAEVIELLATLNPEGRLHAENVLRAFLRLPLLATPEAPQPSAGDR